MKILSLLLILLSLPVLVACSDGGPAETAPEPQSVTVVASDIAFGMDRLEAVAGRPINLTLDNEGVLEHDFSILEIPLAGEPTVTEHADESAGHEMVEDPAVHVAAPAGEHSTILFTPTTPGEYIYYCTVSGHREAGMTGVLVVE
jgi:uncharacterized cupredoxin-like copper-binding protein